ncbi:hypothetical protein OnM2_101010 [Erysiphe neolycopersici]|uniref:Uncharacterized protein n=1 Tax=Erysiphe neolycopersici TaxID=212602 RepID=A0A420H8W9_9PEZI|nr:hypothetical protein OnM2_101010 [Erysiphe neolycopersici]
MITLKFFLATSSCKSSTICPSLSRELSKVVEIGTPGGGFLKVPLILGERFPKCAVSSRLQLHFSSPSALTTRILSPNFFLTSFAPFDDSSSISFPTTKASPKNLHCVAVSLIQNSASTFPPPPLISTLSFSNPLSKISCILTILTSVVMVNSSLWYTDSFNSAGFCLCIESSPHIPR